MPQSRSGFWNDHRRRKRILLGMLVSLLILAVVLIAAAALYWNSLLNLMTDARETVAAVPITAPPELTTEPAVMETIEPIETTATPTASRETVTNIMLIGQNYREGERHKLSDTMLLCSLNRETKTLTLVSFLRDLYVPIPAYAGHSAQKNRMNVCYHYGSLWTGTAEGGMDLLAQCIEENFGISVDHSIEVNFDAFVQIIDALGGVELELTEAEARYLTKHVGYVGSFVPGAQVLNGTEALAYARIRKIDSDIRRTGRQRAVVEAVLQKCRSLGLKQLHELAVSVLPMITTDMTKGEITGYLLEMLPILKDLRIQSTACPVDNALLPGSWWDKETRIGGIPSAVIQCDFRRNRAYLAELLDIEQKT